MKSYCSKCDKTVEAVSSASGAKKCPSCSSQIVSSSDGLQPGFVLNGFLIESRLGQGGMGTVYKAKQINLDRYVALKVLSHELSQDAEFVERFFKEARSAAGLSHPNIVQVYDAGTSSEGIYYFAMELIEGETLDTRIMRDGIVSPKDAMIIALKIAQALDYAWEKQKLSHGDIKPDNIILNSSGGVKLADLGLAKTHHDEKTHSKDGIMATPLYAPPEIIAGEIHRSGFRSDMYSFGATLYHMLAGTAPFNDPDMDKLLKKHLDERPKLLKDILPEINPSISKLVDELLMKNPEDRPSSWKEVAKAIEKVHDVERKVFHKTHVNIPSKEKENAPETISRELVLPKKSSPLKPLVVTITCLLLLLFALLVFIAVKKGGGAFAGKPVKVADRELVAADWNRTKSQLFYIPPDEAIARIEEFLIKYEKAIPPDIMESVEKNKADILKIRREKDALNTQVKDFENELFLIRNLIGQDILKQSVEKVISLKLRMEAILDVSAKKPAVFVLPPADRALINDCYLKITEKIIAFEKEQARLQREAEEKAEKERLEKERIAREQEAQRRRQSLADNALIDSYFIALDAYASAPPQKKDVSALQKAISPLLAEKSVSPEYRKKIEFLNSYAVWDPSTLIGKYSDALVGKPLPIPDLDQQFKVVEIGEKGIKLNKSLDAGSTGNKVIVPKTVQWKQISPASMLSLLKLCVPAQGTIGPTEVRQVLLYLIANGVSGDAGELYERLLSQDKSEANTWISLADDFSSARQEAESSKKWQEYLVLSKEAKYYDAATALCSLYFSSPRQFKKRYSREMELCFQELRKISPQADAASMIVKSSQSMAEKNYMKALAFAASSRARIINANDNPPSLTGAADASLAIAVSSVAANRGIKDPKNIRAPFTQLAKDNPAYPTIAYQLLLDGGSLSTNRKALDTMLMTGYLSLGAWSTANKMFAEGKTLETKKLVKDGKKLFPWNLSFLVSNGLLILKFGNESRGLEIALSEMLKSANSYIEEPRGKVSLALALEFSLLIRNRIKIMETASAMVYSKNDEQTSRAEFRIGLIELIAKHGMPDTSPEILEEAFQRFTERFSSLPEAAGDFAFLKTVVYLSKGNMSLSEDQIKTFSGKLLAPDLCSMLLSSVVAKAMLSDHYVNPMWPVLSRISANRYDSVADNSWIDSALLRLSLANTLQKICERIDELALLPDIASIRYQPKMVLLSAAISARTPAASQENPVLTAERFLRASDSCSERDLLLLSALSDPGKSLEFQSKFASQGFVEDSLWAACIGLILNAGDKQKFDEIEKELMLNWQLLSWNERLFFKRLKTMATTN